jgi:isopenicillin-N epimerase
MARHPFPPDIPGARAHWTLDPSVCFLNHGSFGATPRPVLEAQSEWRARMEREPVLFLGRGIEGLLDEARDRVARFVGADTDGLSFVTNATAGVNTVLRSFPLREGDEVLVTSQGYNACNNAARVVAGAAGASVVVASVPWPCRDPGEVTSAIVAAVTPRTRLAIVDHVTSPTGAVWPAADIVRALHARDVAVVVDGAHAPGMFPLDVRAIGADWYTGNLHKWGCAPKGAAILWTHPDRRTTTLPLAVSHGWNADRTDRSRHRLLFDWTGTDDPTAWLCAPVAIDFLGSLLPGGWPALFERNRALALAARDRIAAVLGTEPPVPDSMVGTLAALRLPAGAPSPAPGKPHPLQEALWTRHQIEIPVTPSPHDAVWNVRLSAAPHNVAADYDVLARALVAEGLGKA